MGLFGHARVGRAALLACGMAWFALVPRATAEPLTVPAPLALTLDSGEPFALAASPIYSGGLLTKWQGVAHKLDDERVQLALCDGDRERCVSDAALKFLAIVDTGRQREGRARLGEINRAINLAIRPVEDIVQYGVIDFWSSPLVTFYHGAGDCEDYAIAKYVALRMAGIAAEDLRIVVMMDTLRHEGHAVAAVRLDGHWLILDNRRMAMVEDVNLRNYRPLFVIDDAGVMKYSDMPLLASMPEPAPAPAAALNVGPGLIGASN
ncbi:transglutaminase-like cysteine peptidase [Bradyrhizobium sp.]|uniref:transglutaminase-like cysteine peptidase n=1 Tax=Bradyrhizobium sp. TaxID=376 RepID=UPI0039C8B86D